MKIYNYTVDEFIPYRDASAALAEDLGFLPDYNHLFIDAKKIIQAKIINRDKSFILSGTPWVNATAKLLRDDFQLNWNFVDGEHVPPEATLAEIRVQARALLQFERVALNFLQLLSGVATQTRKFIEHVEPLPVKIMDTRKTIPGLRSAQKYAVRCGGGTNQRMGLYDKVLLKDNHLILSDGNLSELLSAVQKNLPLGFPLQFEVESVQDFKSAVKHEVKEILLDNMSLEQITECVGYVKAKGLKVFLEASGGINLHNVRSYAQTGIDAISLGTLTKGIKAVDLSLELLGV